LITPPTCPDTGSAATCCDYYGGCNDGDDRWCCEGISSTIYGNHSGNTKDDDYYPDSMFDDFYCSNDSKSYAESQGGILCPFPANTASFTASALSLFLKNYHSPWDYDGFIIVFESQLTTLGRPTKELEWRPNPRASITHRYEDDGYDDDYYDYYDYLNNRDNTDADADADAEDKKFSDKYFSIECKDTSSCSY